MRNVRDLSEEVGRLRHKLKEAQERNRREGEVSPKINELEDELKKEKLRRQKSIEESHEAKKGKNPQLKIGYFGMRGENIVLANNGSYG